jgi:hypothetical protein
MVLPAKQTISAPPDHHHHHAPSHTPLAPSSLKQSHDVNTLRVGFFYRPAVCSGLSTIRQRAVWMLGLVVVIVVSIWRTQTTLPLQIISFTQHTEFTSVSKNETNSVENFQQQQEQQQTPQQQYLNGKKGTNHSKLVPTQHASTASSSFLSICLLMKDDNDILPEWLSYHYHAITLRHLIVAIDPSSQTTPLGILKRFTQHLPQFRFTLWSDVDYMPEWFLRGSTRGDDDGTKNGSATTFLNITSTATTTTTDRVPNLVPKFWFVNASTSPFHQHLAQTNTGNSTTTTTTLSAKQLEQDYNTINEYWFRQRTFLTECIKYIRQTHDDNDEEKEKEKEDEGPGLDRKATNESESYHAVAKCLDGSY